MKKCFNLLFISLLIISTVIPTFAADSPTPKDEVVYGILNAEGVIENLYVVNIFNEANILDYGNYSEVQNLSSAEKLEVNGDQITTTHDGSKFYYQGTLAEKQLPWRIKIIYTLDGEVITPESLGGKSGDLKIDIEVSKNEAMTNNFFDTYALQMSFALDNKLATDIICSNATVAEAAGKKQISYTILPGKGIKTSISAKVENFEMDAISINAIQLNLGLDFDTTSFTSELTQLSDAIAKLDDGANQLLGGLKQVASGALQYSAGLKAFDSGIVSYIDGSKKLNLGMIALSDGLNALSSQGAPLLAGAKQMEQATFDNVNATLQSMGLNLPVLTRDNYTAVLSQAPDLKQLKQNLDMSVAFTNGMEQYVGAVGSINGGALELKNGALALNENSAKLTEASYALFQGALELNEGMKKLKNGFVDYTDGTGQLRDGTKDMNSEIEDKIDEMIGSIAPSGEVSSFVSSKNTNVNLVQFVIKADGISLPAAIEAPEETVVKKSFWEKLLDLFR